MINILFISLQLFTALWPRESDTLKMLFLGDVMQHESQLQSAYDGSTGKGDPGSYDYSPYFKYLKPWFSKADIVAANMETTFAPPPYSGYPVFASPSSLAKEAHRAGINLFFAANNHSADKGARGLKGSLELFREMGIPFTGIYENSEVAHREHPLVIEKEGFKIAILNYTYGTNGIEVPHPYIVKQLDSTLVRKELERAQHLSPDCIIVSVHWGQEYSLEPSASQKKWENLFYSNGADLVIGSHPHVPQKAVAYSDSTGKVKRITVYSLGNAISNMSAKNTRVGIMLEVNLIKEHFTGNKWFGEPVVHYIWTSRPTATGGYYTILPMKEYLENPQQYHIKGEKQLIKNYYNYFKSNQ